MPTFSKRTAGRAIQVSALEHVVCLRTTQPSAKRLSNRRRKHKQDKDRTPTKAEFGV